MFFDRSTSDNVIAVRRRNAGTTSPRHHGSEDSLPTIANSPSPNVRQFLCYVQSDLRALTRTETVNAVIAVTPSEVERVARAVAKMRGRYLAQVLDLGHADRPPLTEADVAQLRRAREWYEEVERGFTALRSAIETGELPLEGVRRD
ncbi:hypothetical protein [Rhodospirillaceae bacterium SYSU D60014]|uniref:hypothetical protein n=1 Tax=Virgifigura deserti TaxID=2268457 RepID=UPI0013C3ED16